MPYKKTNKSKKRDGKTPLKTRVAKLEKAVQTNQNYQMVGATYANVTWNGSALVRVNDLVAGDGIGERNGPTQINSSLTIKDQVVGKLLAGARVPASVRRILFWDYDDSITLLSEVLNLTATIADVNAVYNEAQKHRFKIISDKTFDVTIVDPYRQSALEHYSLKQKKSIYIGNAAADIDSNCLKLFYISNIDPAVGAAEAPSVYHMSTFRYHD